MSSHETGAHPRDPLSTSPVSPLCYETDSLLVLPPPSTGSVKTKSRFNFMELPVELRVKIYRLLSYESSELLILPKAITPRLEAPSYRYPGVSLLTTCKLVNDEMSPVFYGGNTFRITLSSSHHQEYFIRNHRWSTLQCIETMKFYGDVEPSHPSFKSSFTCSGLEMLGFIPKHAALCSTVGPDDETAASMITMILVKLTLAQLADFQVIMAGLFSTHEAQT
ncbi:hypothetical protein BKA65DRAFT_186599 [Rhexocercosporidium sp. MPI-PUGE-AT-0058]|nr:hypothetical protein BKA65DRAFT_186599 [Rhexocercosporidium sp. MPI-PUGE-AT-0058]